MSRNEEFQTGRGEVDLTEGGLDEASIRRPPTNSPRFKDLVRREKGDQARASEGEDMARMAGYGLGSDEELHAHLASHHDAPAEGIRNPVQSHMRYHVEYKNPLGPIHDH